MSVPCLASCARRSSLTSGGACCARKATRPSGGNIKPIKMIVRIYLTMLLRAVSALFEVASSFILRALSVIGRPGTKASIALSPNTMMARRASHRAELARLARDLHDRTAHAIGVAILNLELYDAKASLNAGQAQEKLDRAREAMEQVLDSVRHLSGELRRGTRPDRLELALTEYLAANAGSNIMTNVKVAGDTAKVPMGCARRGLFDAAGSDS
jgi:signal transduction histidine kinase